MKPTTLALCLFVFSLLPTLRCHAEDVKQALSLEFVSCDTNGNLHVKFVNKMDRPLQVDATLGSDLLAYLRVVSIARSERGFLWQKNIPLGDYMGATITIAAQGSKDCKTNIYSADWRSDEQTTAKKLSDGDEVVIIYRGTWWPRWEMNQPEIPATAGTLFCYGKVTDASKPKSN